MEGKRDRDYVAGVALKIPTTKLYTYRIPEHLIGEACIGKRVLVPIKKREAVGWVMEIRKEQGADYEIKDILSFLDDEPLISAEQIELAKWIAEYYLCGLEDVLSCFIPRRLSQKVEVWVERCGSSHGKLTKNQQKLLSLLKEKERVSLSYIKREIKSPYSVISSLEKRGLVKRAKRIKPIPVLRKKGLPVSFPKDTPPILSLAQRSAVEAIRSHIEKRDFGVFLLYGVTGSGKTEVYLRAISEVRKRDRGSVLLVPEISLTPQITERFRARFGEACAILHSKLTERERLIEWQRIRGGEADVVVGARSAVFAPVKNLGLIVIDEEQSASYKQESTPRYNARDVAIMRAKVERAVVVLGSATPSLESFYNAERRKYTMLHLPERIKKGELAECEIVDMRGEKEGKILSRRLISAMEEELGKGHQIMLLMNRRGYSNFIQCTDCGFIPQCANCDITLTFHSYDRRLRCHYCGWSRPAPSFCPKCRGEKIRFSGFGTQQVEREVKKLFREARVLRMDIDTTKKRASHNAILSLFAEKRAEILVGTQMISKGLHFPNVTLVGVISADTSLSLPDFRAAEKTFSLLTQVAGRSGREKRGRVIIQTYNPAHYAIQTALRQDYSLFFKKEMEYRKGLGYPPFSRLLSLILTGKCKEKVECSAERLSETLNSENKEGVDILGPAPYYIPRIKGLYLWQILLRHLHYRTLHTLFDSAMMRFRPQSDVDLIKDMDPVGVV
jgi:primosomal protein N' (replication factor Y)